MKRSPPTDRTARGMPVEKALDILEREKGTKLDAAAEDALAAAVSREVAEGTL